MSKKGTKAATPKETSYELRDIVLAKIRGYPPWPGMIVDPDSVPPNVANERPNAKSKKGTWYCVRFFPAGDHAWIVPKDISKLQRHEIEAYIAEPFKRSGDLLQGYRIALDPTKWEEEIETRRAEAAEEEDNAEVDQLDESDEGEDEMDDDSEKKKSRKRKRESDAAPKAKATKQKQKKESTEPASKKKAAPKGKKNGVKSKAMVESEDEGGAEPEEEDASTSKAAQPPAKKAKKDKDGEDEADAAMANDPEAVKVREWRHKLQKAFLGKIVPKDEDVPALDQVFTTIETYDNMNIHYLSFSKIGKVMRHLYALPDEKVPRDEEFRFRERAKVLIDKWQEVVATSKPANGDTKPATNGSSPQPAAKPEANGSAKAEKESVKNEDKAETKEEAKEEKDEKDAEGDTNMDAPAEPAGEEAAATSGDVAMSEGA